MKKGSKMSKPSKAELNSTIATLTARIAELESQLGRTETAADTAIPAVFTEVSSTATDSFDNLPLFNFNNPDSSTSYFTRGVIRDVD